MSACLLKIDNFGRIHMKCRAILMWVRARGLDLQRGWDMGKLRSIFSFSMTVVILLSGLTLFPLAEAAAQESEVTSAGFVSGPWRVMVLQSVIGDESPEAGLSALDQGEWAIAIADVTNTGATGPFDVSMLQMGTATDSPLAMTNGVAADVASSVSVSQALGLEGVTAEGAFPINENGTIRMAVAVPLAEAPSDGESLVLRLNDQVMSLNDTVVDSLDVAQLPTLVPEMQLVVADIVTATGGGEIDVTLRTGGETTIGLEGVVSPRADAGIQSSCYSGESATQVMNLTGGTVWIEEVPGSGSLVWFNDPAAANFGLLNAHLVAGGFAGVDGETSPYASWLGAVEEYAKSQNIGLWSLCRDAEGTWIDQPTPTPVPTQSPEQVRAEYQWVDTRDLVIRPGEFQGEKIAVSGSVFNIDVEGDLTVMQIWLDGGSEAAVVAYEGDSRCIYEGSWVTIYGTGAGTFEGTNAFGGIIVQPLIFADIVDF